LLQEANIEVILADHSQLGFIPEGDWDALEVMRIPLTKISSFARNTGGTNTSVPLDTLVYPLTASSDAHYPEHIARRSFDLDFADAPMTGKDGIFNEEDSMNIETVRVALQRRPSVFLKNSLLFTACNCAILL